MQHAVTQPQVRERAIRIGEVCNRVGVSRTHLYRLISKGQFPSPFHLSERISVWRESEVECWLAEKFDQAGRAAHEVQHG